MDAYLPAYLKNKNRTRVMSLFFENKELTRPEIAKMTGISMPTVIKITDFLLGKNLIQENPEKTAASDSGFGRKSQILRLNPQGFFTIGIYFEGNALRIGLMNMDFVLVREKAFLTRGEKASPEQKKTLSFQMAEEIEHILQLYGRSKILGIGFALPGIIDCRKQKIRHSQKEEEFEEIYESFPALKKFQDIPLYLENDMNAASLGETIQRKLFHHANLLYLSLGTGFGSGVVINGKIWHGTSYFAGNVGQMLVPRWTENGLQYGKKRYVEEFICQSELQRKFQFDFQDPGSCDEEKRRTVVRYVSQYLAYVINNLSQLLDIQDFVLAGLTVEYFGDMLFDVLQEELGKAEDPERARPELCITPAVNGREGMIGAAYTALACSLPELMAEKPQ